VVTVAAIFQKDPQVLIAHEDVKSFEQMKGKTILIAQSANRGYWPWVKAKFGLTDEQTRPYTFNIQPFVADKNVVQQGYLTSEPYAIQKAGVASQQIGDLAATTNGLLSNDVKPAVGNLNKAVASAQKSMETLDAAIGDARPGLQSFSKQTIPELGQLIHDLRQMSQSLSSVADKIDRGGAGSIVGSPKLPDYKGK